MRILLVIIILLQAIYLNGQDRYLFKVLPMAMIRVDSSESLDLLQSLNGFLEDKKNGRIRKSPYVSADLLEENPYPFYNIIDIEYSKKYNDSNFYKPYLLFAVPISKGQYLVKLSYIGVSPEGIPILNVNYSLLAKREKGMFLFNESLSFNTKDWKKKVVGNITYFSLSPINTNKARWNDRFNTLLAKTFQIKPLKITYYKCSNPEEVFRIKGCDFIRNSYFSETGGLAEQWHNTLYAGNNSEIYKHELVHFYTSQVGQPLNRIADEGYATLVGGSGEKSLDENIRVIKNFITKNKNVDLLNLFLNDFQIENQTSCMYNISGAIAKQIIKVHGFDGIKKLLLCGQSDESYFSVLDSLLGINSNNFNVRISALLMEHS